MKLDEAIKHCEDVAAKCFVNRSARNHSGKCGYEHLELAAWLKELKQLREQTRWIPVSEKLPEEGEEVLVSAYDTYGKKVIIARYQGEKYGFTCGLVSAWMPLPKAYREVEEYKEPGKDVYVPSRK